MSVHRENLSTFDLIQIKKNVSLLLKKQTTFPKVEREYLNKPGFDLIKIIAYSQVSLTLLKALSFLAQQTRITEVSTF